MAADLHVWKGGKTDHETHWADADNWVSGVLPADGDSVRIPKYAAYGIAGWDTIETDTVHLVDFIEEDGCTRQIGTDEAAAGTNVGRLKIDADNVVLGGTGQHFMEIVNHAGDLIVTESAPTTGNKPGKCLIITAGAAARRLVCTASAGQTVGLAALPGQTSVLDEIVVGGTGTLIVGSGVTQYSSGAPDLIIASGTVESRCPLEAVTTRGTYTHQSGTVTTLRIDAGTTTYNSSGTPTTIYQAGGSTLVMGPSAATPTTYRLSGSGARLDDPHGRITSKFNLDNCRLSDHTLNTAANKGWTPGAVS